MARAARERLHSDLGLGITGIAGGDELEGAATRDDAHRAVGRRGDALQRIALPPRARGGQESRGAAGDIDATGVPDATRGGSSGVGLDGRRMQLLRGSRSALRAGHPPAHPLMRGCPLRAAAPRATGKKATPRDST
ncbi:MAG: hypothetical protein U0360_02150 [Dehalococcoidia bacterium]